MVLKFKIFLHFTWNFNDPRCIVRVLYFPPFKVLINIVSKVLSPSEIFICNTIFTTYIFLTLFFQHFHFSLG